MSQPQTNPKNVQQAVKVAAALANPTIEDKNWVNLKERFQLNDPVFNGIKKIIDFSKDSPEVRLVLQCLTFNVQT